MVEYLRVLNCISMFGRVRPIVGFPPLTNIIQAFDLFQAFDNPFYRRVDELYRVWI